MNQPELFTAEIVDSIKPSSETTFEYFVIVAYYNSGANSFWKIFDEPYESEAAALNDMVAMSIRYTYRHIFRLTNKK